MSHKPAKPTPTPPKTVANRRILRALDRRTAPEAREIRKALLKLGYPGKKISWSRAYAALEQAILAGDRTLARRESDRQTDHARRVLVGQRIPWETAQAYRAQADQLGWTMYRWTCAALNLGYKALSDERDTDSHD